MQNSAKSMYALNLEECKDLILSIGSKRTVLLQGDMGNGKSSVLHMLAKDFTQSHAMSIAPRKTWAIL